MKKSLTVLFSVLVFSVLSPGPMMAAEPPAPDAFYKANEINLGAFVGLMSQDFNTGNSGAGIEAAYFPALNFGIRAETFTVNLDHRAVDQLTGLLVYRIPVKKSCPYLFAGGGRDLENWEWNLHFGAGIEHRFTKNFGLFTDVRMVKDMAECPRPPAAMVRAGLRFAF